MLNHLKKKVGRLVRSLERKRINGKLPLHGYVPSPMSVNRITSLSDNDLTQLNSLLKWSCFTTDSLGRRVGGIAWAGKRDLPQAIPDPRITFLNEVVNLSDKHVLEIGCFEGVHTIGLSQLSREVTAVDSRIENVVKTIVRSNLYGFKPTCFKCNIEEEFSALESRNYDVIHHVGVLYHLKDPVEHLQNIARITGHTLLLDTHIANEGEATESYLVGGLAYKYKKYYELGRTDVFSGMYEHAKWLLLEDVVNILKSGGFSDVQVHEKRKERNGYRVLLIARKDK